MGMAINGALVGLAIAAVLFGVELVMLRRRAAERAQKLHRAAALDDTERKQLRTNARFCALLPPAFAFFFWLFWG
jgi:hypothetical protein